MRFQSLIKPNWILKISFGLWIFWESGVKAASSIWQWAMNFLFMSWEDQIFRTTGSGIWLWMKFQTKSFIVNLSSLECVGVFVLFTAQRMMWVIKPWGQNWDGDYFRKKVLTERVIPILQDLMFWTSLRLPFCMTKHRAWKRVEPRTFWKDNNINFFGNEEWPSNSPDLNACENVWLIMKDEVEKRMLPELLATRYSHIKMEEHIDAVLQGMEFNMELFEPLLSSYPARLQAVSWYQWREH